MSTFFDRFVLLIPVPAVNSLDARDDASHLVQREPYPIVDSRDFDELETYALHFSAGFKDQTNFFLAVISLTHSSRLVDRQATRPQA